MVEDSFNSLVESWWSLSDLTSQLQLEIGEDLILTVKGRVLLRADVSLLL